MDNSRKRNWIREKDGDPVLRRSIVPQALQKQPDPEGKRVDQLNAIKGNAELPEQHGLCQDGDKSDDEEISGSNRPLFHKTFLNCDSLKTSA